MCPPYLALSLLCVIRFRKPKHSYQHHKSEVSSRHSAFTRGSAYLERYCLLIAFGAYLEEVTAGVRVWM
jgi:hypothetical protein